jgi:hypothetical protein
MTRQVTDNLYIDLEYFTPEEYYTYEAEATASASASAELSVDIGVIKQGVSTQNSEFSFLGTISHIEGVDIVLSNFASFTLTPSVTREVATSIDSAFTAVAITVAGNLQNASASFVSEFAQTTDIDHLVGASSAQSSSATLSVDAVANRSAAITLDTIGNLDAQAARTRDYSSDLASAFTVTALSNSILEFDAFLEYEIPDLFVDAVITAEGVIDAGALFSPNIVADAFKNHTAILETTASLTIDAEKTASAVSAQTSVFTQAALASKLVEAASTPTSAFAQTVAVSRTRPGSASFSSACTLSAQGIRPSRIITSSAFVGDAYSELEITNEQAKFGGKSLKIPATTAVSPSGNGEQLFWTGSAFKVIQTGTTWTSTDGLTWTTASNNLSLFPDPSSLVFQNNQFLIKSGSTIAYANSTGTSFSTTTLADTGFIDYYDRIDFFNGFYYVPHRRFTTPSTNDVIGFYRSASLTSPSWSEVNIVAMNELIGGGVQINTIASSGSTLAMQIKAGDNSNYSIYRSTNGTTWSNAVPPTTDSVELTFANNLWVLNTATAIWTSSDLITWTSQSISITGLINKIYYLNNKWIVVTTYALYSGSALNSLSAVIVKDFNESFEFFPAFGDSKYIVLSNDEVLYSTDAVTWSADALEGVTGLAGYIEYTGSSDINSFNSIDFWVYNDNTNGNFTRIFTRASGLSNFRIILNSNTLQVFVTDGTNGRSISTGNILPLGWSHIRFVQDGANASLYSGGTRRATSTTWLSFSTDTFYIGGVSATKPLYIDEFLISDSILTPTSTTSYTVPTVPWTNSSTVDALFHYDTSFDDDAATTDRFGAAVLSTAFTVAATGTEIVSLSAALASSASQSATAEIVKDVSASLASQGFVVTVAGYLQDDVADLSASFTATINGSATLVADTSVSAESTLSALAGRVQSADASVSAQFDVTAQGDRARLAQSTLASEFAQSTDAVKTASAAVSVTESATVNAQGNLVAETISSISAQTQAVIDGSYTANGQSDFEATGFVISVVAKTGLGAVDMQSQFALSCDTEVVYEQSASLAVTATLTSATDKIIEFSTIETILGVTNNSANQSPTGPFLKLTQSESTTNVGCFYVSAYLKDALGYIFDSYPNASEFSTGSNLRIETAGGIPSFYYNGENGYVAWQLSNEDIRSSIVGFHHYYLRVNIAETTNQLKYRLFFDGVEIPQSTVSGTDIVMRVSGTYNLMMDTGFQNPYWRASVSNSGYGDIGGGYGPAGMAQFVFDYKTSYTTATFPVTDIEKVFPYQDLGTAGTDTGLAAPIQYINLENYTDLSNRGTLGGTYAWKQLSLVSGQNYNLNDFSATSSNNLVGFTNNIIAISSLTATGQSVQVISANISAQAALAATVAKTISAQASLDSAVAVTADVLVTRTFSLALDSNFALSATAASTQDYTANFTVTSTLTADGIVESGAIADFSTSATLSANAGLLAEGTVSINSNSTLSANADKIKDVLMTVDSACAVQATAIKTAVAEGTLANTATLTADVDKIVLGGINLLSAFAVAVSGNKFTGVVSSQQAQFTLTTAASKLVGISANFTAFYSQLTVGRVISLDPYTTYVIPQETRAYKIHRETRLFTVESESRSYKIRKESRLYTIDSESRIYNIKG